MDSQRKTRPTAVPVKVYCLIHHPGLVVFDAAAGAASCSSSWSLSISRSIAIATPFLMPPA
ncbi:Uncharacterised protein [Mycobacteroides abscessus subsp. abscessus]|nr:Uncharacterised protein [Mycobacteroides abscessus subsp. abscessus]SKV17518.1 Uncharacterised protein [Mycobacteroides abscessus subsp. abscessus]